MSKTIDQRVVEMKFDNRDFEKNTRTSMSTLEKLKQSLNLTGASKGLENINEAAKNNNMDVLSKSVEAVGVKFSAMQVMATTALVNLTNSAMNAGKKIASAIFIEPRKMGFQEYETQLNAVQTILANTSHAGTTLDDVNYALDTLNTYADKTIYNFTEMTRNIGTFTAAGIDLDKSVSSIQGIANLAAVSGSTSQQASTAMYQLSQALAAGTVKLMDWNSVVNAGMGGKVFQDALKRTAEVMGTNVDALIEQNGSFRESLQEGWITAEVLTETLNQFTLAAEEGSKEWKQFKSELKEKGYTDAQAEEILKMANTATDAATKVKTFTQLIDTLKESLQSGWTQTWEILIGDFEEAKELFSGISDALGKIIGDSAEKRNSVLSKAFSEKPWDKFIEKVNKAGISTDKFQEALLKTGKKHSKSVSKMIKDEKSFNEILASGRITKKMVIETLESFTKSTKKSGESTEDMTAKLKKFQKVVDEVWAGKYGNGEERVEALTKAGYKYAEVQDLVNKTVDGHKLTLEDLSVSQLKNIGYTDKQIKVIKELSAEAKKSGSSINELLDDMSKPSGRDLLIDSFKNIAEFFTDFAEIVKEAWTNIFGDESEDEKIEKKADGIYGLIEKFHSLTESMQFSENAGKNLKGIFEGLFAAFEVTHSVLSWSILGGLKILNEVLKFFGLTLMDVLNIIADFIVKVRNWIKENTLLVGWQAKVGKMLGTFIEGLKKCVDAFMNLKAVKDVIKDVKDAVTDLFDKLGLSINFKGTGIDNAISFIEQTFTNIESWIKKLDASKFMKAGSDIVRGLAFGIIEGVDTAITAIVDLASNIIKSFKDKLGIKSPSKIFFALGGFIIMGLINGIEDTSSTAYKSIEAVAVNLFDIVQSVFQDGLPYIIELVKTIGSKTLDTLKANEIDFGAIFVAGSLVAATFFLKKLLEVVEGVVSPVKKLGNVLGAVEGILKSFNDMIDAKIWKIKADAIFTIAKAIGILAASLYIISNIEWQKLAIATGVLTILVGELFVLTKMVNGTDVTGFAKLSTLCLAIGASVILMSLAMKNIASIDPATLDTAMVALVGMLGGIVGLIFVYGKCVKGLTGFTGGQMGSMLLKMAAGLVIMSFVIKIIAGMEWSDIAKGLAFIAGVEVLFAGVMWVSQYAGANGAIAGAMLRKMAIAIGILALSVKLIATMSWEDIMKGGVVIGAIMSLFAGLVLASFFAGKHASKAGSMLLKMSLAIAILSGAMKILASISTEDTIKCLTVIKNISKIFMVFTALSLIAGPNAGKIGALMLGMSAGIAILAIAIRLLAGISSNDVVKGLFIISTVETLFMVVVALSKYAGPNADKAGQMLMKMSTAILILSGAIFLLSLLDPKDVAVGTAAISALLLCFGGLIAMTKIAGNYTKTITTLMIAFGVLAGGVAALAALDEGKVATAAASLVGVMGMFALIMKVAQTADVINVKSLITLTVIVGLLGGIIFALDKLEVFASITNAASISLLLLSMAASLKLVSYLGPTAISAVGALALMGLVVAELAIILGLMTRFDINPSIETAKSLSILLIAMSGALAILTVVGVFGPAAFVGIGALATLIAGIGGLVVGIGALMDKFPKLQEFLNIGIPVLEQIGRGVGSFFGNFAAGIMDGATSTLPQVGTNLSDFMSNASGFIEGAKTVDPTIVEGVKSLADAILTLTAANVIESLSRLFTGGSSIADFGYELSEFGGYLQDYSASVAGVDAEGIQKSAKAIKYLAEAADAVPNEGGIISWFAGENSLASFGPQLAVFGTHLQAYSTSVNGINIEAVSASAKAVKTLAQAASEIPEEGGWAAKIFGDNSIASFASQMPIVGTCLNAFSTNLGTFTNDQVTTVKCAANAIKAMAEAGGSIDGQSEWAKTLFGDNSLSTFSGQLPTLATNLASFVTNLGTFTDDQVTTVNSAVKAIKAFANLGGIDISELTYTLPTFGMNMVSFGDNLVTFCNNLADIEDNTASETLTELVSSISETAGKISENKGSFETAGSDLINSLKNGINSKKDSINTACVNIISSLRKKIIDTKTEFEEAGKSLAGALKSGLANKEKKTDINTAAEDLVTKAAEAISDKASSFTEAGQDLGDGLVLGIESKEQAAYNAGYALGQKAVQGEKDGQKSKSPSKLTKQAGKWLGEGLIIGINEMGKKVYNAGYNLGDDAAKSMSRAVSRISSMIDSDMDTQPTIRPVLDLSNVEDGVGTIGGMFGNTNLGPISTMMNRRSQNGVNSDVVNAIDKLRGELGNVGGTYSINGVNYNEGSDVSEAIKTIVRAATVERRV